MLPDHFHIVTQQEEPVLWLDRIIPFYRVIRENSGLHEIPDAFFGDDQGGIGRVQELHIFF